ncbi:MAG: hypothetical protein ACTHLW_08095 [Verrucomicrobiota bacterium]
MLATPLVNVIDALLEIHAGFNGTQDFVARAKDTFEKLEFLGQ